MKKHDTIHDALYYASSQLLKKGIKTKLQYHKYNDTISAVGYNLSAYQHAIGNITKHGYGRYVVAKIESVTLDYGYIAYDMHGMEL